MKTNTFLSIVVFLFFSVSSFAQLKVNSTGKVGIGLDPDATYNLSLSSMVSIAGGGYPNLIMGGDPAAGQSRAIYPTVNNTGTKGTSANQLFSVYAKFHYATGVLLTSDKRLKENFRNIDKPLEKLLQMNGQEYDFISQDSDSTKSKKAKEQNLLLEKNRLGFIAQDLQKIVPEAVIYFKDEDRYYIDYNAVIPVIVEAMKEQQSQIEVLKSEVASCCKANLKSASLTTGTTTGLAENIVQLEQNVPNPFSRETRIGCTIPEASGTSVLYIYNMNGTQLQQYSITGKAKQTVTINGNSFEPGMYLYALVIDGQEVDTKRMILTK